MESNSPVRPNRSAPPARPAPPRLRNDSRNPTSAQNQNQPQRRQNTQNSQFREFHNPYNFVPALPRQGVGNELGDRLPSGHGSYLENRWSGRIRITLKTITPLLIPDASQAKELRDSKHKTYPLRLMNGEPYLPPTSIKGTLRSAYETATNSRLSIFSKHDNKLAYRMLPDPKIKPAIIIKRKQDGQLFIKVMQAAKLLCYKDYDENVTAPLDKGASEIAAENCYPDNHLPKHGDLLWVKLTSGKVRKITQFEPRQPNEKSKSGWQKGWACITGPNCKEKRYERVFLESPVEEIYEIEDHEIELWEKLIADYQTIHRDDLKDRSEDQHTFDAYLGHEPGQTGWSRHIYTDRATKLRAGTLCYVQFGSDEQISAIIPVTISRRLFQYSPDTLLSESLKPATKLDELSPADRVFGWVNQQGNGSYRGQLRIHSVECLSSDPIQSFTDNPEENPGLPLTILGQPKPQQSRFYVSSNKNGKPLPDRTTPKQDGYASTNQGLRGRKVYPHHKAIAQNADYWNNPTDDRTDQSTNGYYQEYRRPQKEGNEQRDSQNRSIQAWVKPGTQFQFEIDVINLSDVELGALLWLLKLPDDHYHRLGGGKPLGFGSVQLAIDWEKTDLRIGQDWKTYYESLLPIENANSQQVEQCIEQFKNAVSEAYDRERSFEEVQFIKAFLQAARGLDKPIHYPRVRSQPDPEGENYKWFTANESRERRSLPPLWNETGLPYWE